MVDYLLAPTAAICNASDMNNHGLPEGPGWSPDGGDFWVKGDKIYWEDGDVTMMKEGQLAMIRTMGDAVPESEWHQYDNFSAWTDEKRAEVVAKNKNARVKQKEEDEKEYRQMRDICIRAKAKLDKEEYEAIQWTEYRGQDPVFLWGDLP